jgi:2-C-methyl-D-erythritol 4-phosphate cytidylyltransferase
MRLVAVIAAAGASTRMGYSKPKPLLDVSGVSILLRSISLFAGHTPERLIVTYPEAYADEFLSVRDPTLVELVQGGATRFESIERAVSLIQAEELEAKNIFVAIHDASRCLASPSLLQRVIETSHLYGAAAPAVPVVDNLCRDDGEGRFGEPIAKDHSWQLQTPQVFRLDLLRMAYSRSTGPTPDEATLVARYHRVHLVAGERQNIRIVTPEDLALAQVLAMSDTQLSAADEPPQVRAV